MNRLEYLKGLLQEDDSDPFLYFALAKEHEKSEEWDAAREQYEYLLEAHPDYLGTYYHLGKLYEILELKEEASDCYRKGIEVASQQGDEHAKSELVGARTTMN